MKFPIISIKTTSLCQLRCKNCFVVKWMNKYPSFHWSIGSVKNFINATHKSGYHFKIVLLSGGEPLLWKNIIEGTRLIKQSGITDCVKILTNSVAVTEKNIGWFSDVIENIDNVRISRYIGNDRSIEIIKQIFPNDERIHISDKTEFLIQTDQPIPDSTPAVCHCDYPTVFGDNIDVCGGMRFLSLNNRIKVDPSMVVKIRTKYLDYFSSKECMEKKLNQEACKYCMVNKNVIDKLKKEKNVCLKGEIV